MKAIPRGDQEQKPLFVDALISNRPPTSTVPMNTINIAPGFSQQATIAQVGYPTMMPPANYIPNVALAYQNPNFQPSHVIYTHSPVMYAPAQIMLVTPTLTTPTTRLGPNSCLYNCQYCKQTSMTRSVRSLNDQGWLAALLLCFFCYPLIWAVTCYPTNYKHEHFCTQCKNLLGAYDPSKL